MTTVYHEADCGRPSATDPYGEHTCGGVWQCSHCGRLFGFCHGAHSDDDTDEENEACDDCWSLLKATVPE
jgi:DNA-directed RNA polymerase subunit RPC12/RpoP